MKRLARGFASLLVLITLLIVAPAAWATLWGNPWPSGGLAEVRLGTTDALIGVLVAFGWLAWGVMSTCILAEVLAALTGRPAWRIPFALPGQQDLAHLLVTSVVALGIGASTATLGGAAILSSPPLPAHASTLERSAASASGDVDGNSTDGYGIVTKTVTTPWRVADAHLGDGARWKEILDLNHGITLPDGTTFTRGTQSIPAGTALRLPTDANPPTSPPTITNQNSPADSEHEGPDHDDQHRHTVTVVPDDTLSEISLEELGDGTRKTYMRVFRASKDTVQPGGEHLADPDLIKPGWIITIPTDHDRSDKEPDPKSDQGEPSQTREDGHGGRTHRGDHSVDQEPQHETAPHEGPHDGQTTPAPPADPELEHDGAGPSPSKPHVDGSSQDLNDQSVAQDADDQADVNCLLGAPWVLVGLTGAGTLLAGGLLVGLRQRRRAQVRARRPGRTIAVSGPELAPVERTILAAGEPAQEPLDLVDQALQRLAGATLDAGGIMPALAAADIDVASRRRLTLHLSEPANLPEPWQPTPDRLHWHVPATIAIEELGPLRNEDADPPYPMLLTVGQSDSGALWLLNFEDLGVVTLGGDAERAAALARHLSAQLVVNPWSQGAEVDCIGTTFDGELGDLGVRYHLPDEGSPAVDGVLAKAVTMVDRATRHGTDVATARTGQTDGDIWPTHMLLIEPGVPEPESLDQLLDVVDSQVGRSATAVVLIGKRRAAPGTELRLTSDGRLSVERAGLNLIAVGLTSDEARGIGMLYAQADVLDSTDMPIDFDADQDWEAYTDRAGRLRPEHTHPRATSETDLTEPTTTLLEGNDTDYEQRAAVVAEDLDTLASKVPTALRNEVEEADPTLDDDLAAWHAEDTNRARLSLLGPVIARTHGKALPKRRAYFTELLAYLWLHRQRGVVRDQIVDAFGTPPDRVRKDISVLRDWLGNDPRTGLPYLPAADESPIAKATGINAYQLTLDGLLVDWDLLKRLRLRGTTRGGNDGRADLIQALNLVSGRPCHHQREGGWTWLAEDERHDHYMAVAIADVALTVTTHCLHEGDTEQARAATETAILAAPDEETTRLCLVQITHQEGNPTEARRLLINDVRNRSDDGQAPTDLSDRTRAVIGNHDDWLAS